ncbi:MAG: 50S ribosomal protein L35 [Candidatus Auribacterota bacterium]|jgi:large subunit ribosomal protein L35|nr:50S ribosomal protein L35 [Candidatus Auribacterota bacterium]
MPKLKTNKAASKRFKLTANGKVKKNSAFASHILTKKSSKRKRQLRNSEVLAEVDVPKVKKLLPYA